MNLFKKMAVLPMAAVILMSCQNGPNKEETGTVLGGIIGGALSSNIGGGKGKTMAIIGGTMLGAYFGNSVGASLDRADRMFMQNAQSAAYSAPVGQQINWNNPESKNAGSITPTRDGTSARGQYCREFQQTIIIDGRSQDAYGTACQEANGTWKILN